MVRTLLSGSSEALVIEGKEGGALGALAPAEATCFQVVFSSQRLLTKMMTDGFRARTGRTDGLRDTITHRTHGLSLVSSDSGVGGSSDG